jgi:hypothetical protein
MTLTTHAIVGAAVASTLPNHPVLGFAVGFASHFLLDAMPHWDYKLRSATENPNNPLAKEITLNKDFIFDLFKMGCDAIFGALVGLFLFGIPNFNLNSILSSMIVWGIIGGLTPDALQFVYFKWKHEPMISLQKFHAVWIHSKIKLDNRPVLGISLQIILIIVVVAITKLI